MASGPQSYLLFTDTFPASIHVLGPLSSGLYFYKLIASLVWNGLSFSHTHTILHICLHPLHSPTPASGGLSSLQSSAQVKAPLLCSACTEIPVCIFPGPIAPLLPLILLLINDTGRACFLAGLSSLWRRGYSLVISVYSLSVHCGLTSARCADGWVGGWMEVTQGI